MRTVILRHRKENLKKCSLRGLERREDMAFYTYPSDLQTVPVEGSLFLTLDGTPLSAEDRGRPLLILDGTWRYAQKMEEQLGARMHHVIPRSIPSNFLTAYPRKQEDCQDPNAGLASIEAIYIAYKILGYPTEGLLDSYYWKEDFLSRNAASFHSLEQLF